MQKTRPELVAQEEVDIAQGKDLEANAGVSAAKDALAASEQALLGAKAALEKDKAMYAYANITAPFDGVVTEIDAYTGALLPAGTSSNKGDQALCRFSQNDLLRLVIPVPERAVADVHVGRDGCRERFDDESDVRRKDRAILRPNRYGNAHDAYRNRRTQSEVRSSFPECMPRFRFHCTPCRTS